MVLSWPSSRVSAALAVLPAGRVMGILGKPTDRIALERTVEQSVIRIQSWKRKRQ